MLNTIDQALAAAEAEPALPTLMDDVAAPAAAGGFLAVAAFPPLPKPVADAVAELAELEAMQVDAVEVGVQRVVRRLCLEQRDQRAGIAEAAGKEFARQLKDRQHPQAPQRAADFRAIIRAAVANPEAAAQFRGGLQAQARQARAIVKARARPEGAGRKAAQPKSRQALRHALQLVHAWARDHAHEAGVFERLAVDLPAAAMLDGQIEL